MTHITFDRSGGTIGNDLHLDLQLEDLAEADAQNLRRLIDEADFFDLPEDLVIFPSTDEFQYTITVDTGHRSHTVQLSDNTMPGSLLPLIKELTLLKMLQS